MQTNTMFLLALYLVQLNGGNVPTWVWIVAWVMAALRFISITVTTVEKKRDEQESTE